MDDKQRENILVAKGRVQVAYLALSGARDLLKDTGQAELANAACLAANNLDCAIIKALIPTERGGES